MYSIKAITSLTGIGAETLRAWERRYQTIAPRRDEGGRRFYSQQDLDKLMLLANLTRQGHAISKLSGLEFEGLQKLLTAGYETNSDAEQFVNQIIEALFEYRIDRCEQLLKKALMVYEPLAYIREILSPALHHVGNFWQIGRLNVAQEHIFSACVKRILLGMVNNLHSFSANSQGILFATPSGEPHEFGILMCCLLAAEQHYNCYYLGADLPVEDLLSAADKLQVDIMVLGVTKHPLEKETAKALDRIYKETSHSHLSVWLGGSAVQFWQPETEHTFGKNWQIISDIDDFYAKAQQQLIMTNGRNGK